MDYLKELASLFDKEWLSEHIINLYRIERKQTFKAYNDAADYVYKLLKAEGFDSELLNFPADGKTVYQDKCSPIGWDANKMTLTLEKSIPEIDSLVIADFEKDPLSVVKHSTSTPPEGIRARIVTEAQMKAGEDVQGALILLNQYNRGRKDHIKAILDLGAIGWVSDHLENPHTTPDSVSWSNAATETNSWHVQSGDRDFIAFNIPPRISLPLRNACENGDVYVRIYSDAVRHESTIPAITALLPGESEKEIWVMSHMYEPLIDDNANGVIGSIAMLKALRTLSEQNKIKLKYSIRLVFAAEMYGVAAVAEHFGGDLSNRCIGGMNTDGLCSAKDKTACNYFEIKEAVDAPGFAGNIFLHAAADSFKKHYPNTGILYRDHGFGDDRFLSDSTTGLPTIWIEYATEAYHHNSCLDESMFDLTLTIQHLSLHSEWLRYMAAADEEEIHALVPRAVARANEALLAAAKSPVRTGTDTSARMKFIYEREVARIKDLSLWSDSDEINAAANTISLPRPENTLVKPDSDIWFNYCENFVFSRITRGLPHDLVALPRDERRTMPGAILYNTVADIVSRIDGKKNLKTIISEVEWDRDIIFRDSDIQKYLHTFTMLVDSGYFGVKVSNPLTADLLAEALSKLGVKQGDTLLVHSALSKLGYLENGAKTAIEALRKAVGDNGTFLAPAFTRPYISFEGSVNKNLNFRPYDTREEGELRDKGVYTGVLPRTMLKEKGSKRSGHVSHEWVALGKDAEACVSDQGFLDTPTGKGSPLEHALKRNGSVVFLGCSITSNTFLHYVETITDAPFLHPATVAYIDKNGKRKTAFIEKHLGGHRSFYENGGDNEFYHEAQKRGLKIHKQPFGLATLYRIELSELFDIAMQMFEDDSCATLCSNPECRFCKQFK